MMKNVKTMDDINALVIGSALDLGHMMPGLLPTETATATVTKAGSVGGIGVIEATIEFAGVTLGLAVIEPKSVNKEKIIDWSWTWA